MQGIRGILTYLQGCTAVIFLASLLAFFTGSPDPAHFLENKVAEALYNGEHLADISQKPFAFGISLYAASTCAYMLMQWLLLGHFKRHYTGRDFNLVLAPWALWLSLSAFFLAMNGYTFYVWYVLLPIVAFMGPGLAWLWAKSGKSLPNP